MTRINLVVSTLICFLLVGPTTSAKSEEVGTIFPKGPVLSLQKAMARGIEHNLDIIIQELNVPISRDKTVVQDADFDPIFEIGGGSLEQKYPSASVLTGEDFNLLRETNGTASIRKKFKVGLEGRSPNLAAFLQSL